MTNIKKTLVGSLLSLSIVLQGTAAFGQRSKPAAKTPKPAIFAVLNDGKMIEPIAYINRSKLETPVSGSDPANALSVFNRNYYKKGTNYRLIFGGVDAGSVSVESSEPNSDCGKNIANVLTRASKTQLSGLVMGLATNAAGKKKTTSGIRRKPTTAERNEIEVLVKAELAKHKLTPKVLRYHNLTVLDVDRDSKPEIVGSYWVEIDKMTRGLLFFIASNDSKGKYHFSHKDYRTIDQANVMSGEIKSVDEGIYHELLLDSFDYDGDGTGEIFTYVQSFEGAGFSAYRRVNGKWGRVYEFSNYHCGY